jgi:hypothetical protein
MRHTAWRKYSLKGSSEKVVGTFPSSGESSGIRSGMRVLHAKITSVAISLCALVVISLVRLITLFWRPGEAPEISLKDVEERR